MHTIWPVKRMCKRNMSLAQHASGGRPHPSAAAHYSGQESILKAIHGFCWADLASALLIWGGGISLELPLARPLPSRSHGDWHCEGHRMLRHLARRAAGPARRAIATSAASLEGEAKGPAGAALASGMEHHPCLRPMSLGAFAPQPGLHG